MHIHRDEEILIQHSKKTPSPHLFAMTVDYASQDCHLYGHSWQSVGTAGAKYCTACGITGYCPGCTPIAPLSSAHPFYCTRHTPRHAPFSEEEGQL